MLFLAATGKIDPRKVHLNGDHALFVLQDGKSQYWVKTMGIEQYNMVQNYRPGQSVFMLGTGQQDGKKVRICPRLLLNLTDTPGQSETILQITLQIMESHLK